MFRRVITYEAVTLFHIGTTYTCKFTYSSLLYNGIISVLLLENSIFKYKPCSYSFTFLTKDHLVPILFSAGRVNALAGVLLLLRSVFSLFDDDDDNDDDDSTPFRI